MLAVPTSLNASLACNESDAGLGGLLLTSQGRAGQGHSAQPAGKPNSAGWKDFLVIVGGEKNERIARFFAGTRAKAEQLDAVQRWYRILSEALRKYLRGRQLIPPARLQPG